MRGISKAGILLCFFFFSTGYLSAQVFWTETFGTGCNAGTLANGFVSVNGTWTIDAPVANNDADANRWYISATENGEGVGNCGAACGTNPTLHIGGMTDNGADYSKGAQTSTDAKAISPAIDCSNKCAIELSFEYIENGDGTDDNLIVWYFDGSTWTVLEDTPKTPFGACAPQGLWTNRTIALPVSANNNADVQIAFQWVNNNDGLGTNPSAAIYNIQLSSTDNIAPTITCPSNQTVNNGTNCGYQITDFTSLATATDNCGVPTLTQIPAPGTEIGSGMHTVELIAEDGSGNTTSCTFELTVYESTPPVITCPSDTVSCEPVVAYDAPIVVENCTGYTLTQNDATGYTSGDAFPIGVTNQSYEVIDASGNVASCNFNVEILELPSTAEILTVPAQFCDENSVALEATAPTSGVGEWTVITGNATLTNQFANTTGANNLSFGINTFVWTVTSSSCGATSDTVSMEVFDNPSQANTQNDLTICGDTSVNIVATSPSVGVGSWTSVNGTASFLDDLAPNTVLYDLDPGWNEIVWTVSNGVCPSTSDTLRVYTNGRAEIYSPDTTVCLVNKGFQLQGSPIPNGVKGIWYGLTGGIEITDQKTSTPTVLSVSGGDNYIVYGHNHPVCGTTTDTIKVEGVQCDAYNPVLPTVITPNADGRNDLFVITDLNVLYPNAMVTIVNRWGNLVFESEGYEEPWDGTLMNNGEELPMGTYFYRILLNDSINTEITGPISIIR